MVYFMISYFRILQNIFILHFWTSIYNAFIVFCKLLNYFIYRNSLPSSFILLIDWWFTIWIIFIAFLWCVSIFIITIAYKLHIFDCFQHLVQLFLLFNSILLGLYGWILVPMSIWKWFALRINKIIFANMMSDLGNHLWIFFSFENIF